MTEPWTIPRMWEGRTVAILASGPSMSVDVVATVRAAGVLTIAINRTWELAPWADMLFAGDAPWWTKYYAETREFAGIQVCAEETPHADVMHIRTSGKEGFDPDPARIRTGGNSGYGAMHIAAHAGAARLLLCGFDMRGGHWHGRHPMPLYDGNGDHFARWIGRFELFALQLAERDIEVLNCTEGSALPWFPMARLEDALGA